MITDLYSLLSNPEALANAVISAVIVLALMFYRRCGSKHRPFISLLAYIVVLIYASIPFTLVFGLYCESNWLVVIGNTIICGVLLWHKGNLARIVDHLRGIK